MSAAPVSDRHAVLRALLAGCPADSGAPPAGPCPDDNDVAAFLDGTLLPAARDRVEEHLSWCPACREVLLGAAALGADDSLPLASVRALPARRRVPRFALAAAAVLVVSVGLYVVMRSSGTTDTESALVAAAGELRRQDAALFADFLPLDRRERLEAHRSTMRGSGPEILEPRGLTLDPLPMLVWEERAGASRYVITLEAAGDTLFSVGHGADAGTGDPPGGVRQAGGRVALELPASVGPLEPHRLYTFKIACVAGGRAHEARRDFWIASADERTRLEAVVRVVRDSTPPRLQSLLLAHCGLRRGLDVWAEERAREVHRADPTDTVGIETLLTTMRGVDSAETARLRRELAERQGRTDR
jgi:hypothetical protein